MGNNLKINNQKKKEKIKSLYYNQIRRKELLFPPIVLHHLNKSILRHRILEPSSISNNHHFPF